MVDQRLVAELTSAVQEALVAEATARVQAGKARLDRRGQEVLAESVLRDRLQRLDPDRLAAGSQRLDEVSEQLLVDRVLALSVGLGPVEVVLADPTVEEVVATRFDLVFAYRSDGSVEQVEERLWASEAELSAWLSHLARTAGRTERQFNAQAPMLVMRLGDGMRLAATRDVSKAVSFSLRRNTLGKVTLADPARPPRPGSHLGRSEQDQDVGNLPRQGACGRPVRASRARRWRVGGSPGVAVHRRPRRRRSRREGRSPHARLGGW